MCFKIMSLTRIGAGWKLEDMRMRRKGDLRLATGFEAKATLYS